MRENLVPAQITDKNGHLTTRWVKPGTGGTGTSTNLPVPYLPTQPAINYREELQDLLRDTAHEYSDDHTKFYTYASENTLAYIHEALTSEDAPDELPAQISCLMSDNVEDHVIEAWIHLHDMHEGTMDDMGEVDYIRGAINSGEPLGTYDRNNPEHAQAVRSLFHFLLHTDSEQHAIRMRVGNGVTTQGLPAHSHEVTNPNLADYIVRHPEHVDLLIGIANSHPHWLQGNNFTSSEELPEMIREYMDTTTPMQQGVL